MVTKSRVDDLIIENGKVEGVMAGEDALTANIVIGCDGVLSLLAKSGLRKSGSWTRTTRLVLRKLLNWIGLF
jgi:electron transfer flavoprotein-quinone oxidoreductase